jgi:Phage integrase, N-terminal SAM-like domain
MVQTFFKRSCTIDRLRQGPLAGHIDLLAARLATHGYSRVHSRIQLRLVGHFNRWLEQKHLTAEQLDEDVIELYRRYLKRRKRVRSEDVCTLVRLLDLLREQGVTPRNVEATPTAREILLEKYRRYLREERGLAEASLRNMLIFVDRFLVEKYPRDHVDFAALAVSDITTFVRRQATELGSAQAKHLVSALRSFFRYLRHCGEIHTDLAGCVPCVPDYSFSAVPKFLPAGSVAKILRRTDRSIPRGRARLRHSDAARQILDSARPKSSAWILKMSIGNSAKSQFGVRAGDGPNCRCRPMLGSPLPPICSTTVRAAQLAACSSPNAPQLRACPPGARSSRR